MLALNFLVLSVIRYTFNMLVRIFLVPLILQGILVEAKSVLPEALKYAVAKSFNVTADIIHIVIETDFNENTVSFLETFDNIMMEKWKFGYQIDVNNIEGQCVSDFSLWFIDSYDAFRRILPWIRSYHKDSQIFYFIVLKISNFKESLLVTQKIFSDFLMLMVGNVNVIIENASREVLFYTFYPYQEFACRSAKPFIINRFISNKMEHAIPFFPSKAINLNGCILRIKTRNFNLLKQGNFEVGVLEVVIVNELSSRMNFTSEIIATAHNDPLALLNANSSGPHKSLANGEIDAVIGAYPLNSKVNHFLSKSVSYLLSWVIIAFQFRPNIFRRNIWIFVSFNSTILTFTVMTFAVTAGCIIWIKKTRRLKKVLKYFQHGHVGVLELLAVAIGAPVVHLPNKTCFRIIFIIISLGLLVLRTVYIGKLFDAYRGMRMIKYPLDLEELIADEYTIYTHKLHESIINEMNGMENVRFEQIGANNLRILFDKDEDDKKAFVSPFIFVYTIYKPEERKQMILRKIFGDQICMFFQQHSIFVPRINEIIVSLEEAGILHYLRRNYEDFNNVEFYVSENSQEPRALVLSRFGFIFCLLGIVEAIAILVFIAEPK